MKSLLIGCGNSRQKKLFIPPNSGWGELTTMDMDPNCGADIIFDLAKLSISRQFACIPTNSLPFAAEYFDEIAAYDVLEHFGAVGDWRGWFTEMAEFHRVLKPGGTFGIIVPLGEDALADPGHTRYFSENHFRCLNQSFYQQMHDQNLPCTDYRWYYSLNFNVIHLQRIENHHLGVMLEKA